MKKIIATSLLITALAFSASAVSAEDLSCQSQGQYGGGVVCGTSTSTETVVEHKTVDAGIADWTLAQIIVFAGVSAIAATLLYKATYRLYIFG